MNPVPLPGLIGSQPIGALAAFGLLRICSSTQIGGVKLGWDLGPLPKAMLWFEHGTTLENVIGKILLPWMAGRWVSGVFGVGDPTQKDKEDDTDAEPVEDKTEGTSDKTSDGAKKKSDRNRGKAELWDNDIKVSPMTFASELRKARAASCLTCRQNADHLVGYGTDARESGSSSKGKVISTTRLCMTAGQQKLLQLLRYLAFTLDSGGDWSRPFDKKKTKMARTHPVEAFRQALTEEWDFAYKNDRDEGFHALGWDAESYCVAALQGQATPDFTPPRAAIWLAAEALPLFPCTPTRRYPHAQTRGFDRASEVFRWPLWRQPLSLRAVQIALGLPALYEDQVSSEVLQAFGVDLVYGSGIIKLTDYKSFRPPILLANSRLEAMTADVL